MSTQAHTPGPWRLEGLGEVRGNKYEIKDSAHRCVATTAPSYCIPRSWTSPDECDANAHLIAAVPDLYEFAVRVADYFQDTDAPLGAAARAVIAKAEGQ